MFGWLKSLFGGKKNSGAVAVNRGTGQQYRGPKEETYREKWDKLKKAGRDLLASESTRDQEVGRRLLRLMSDLE